METIEIKFHLVTSTYIRRTRSPAVFERALDRAGRAWSTFASATT